LINTGAEAGQRDTVKLELKDGTSHEFMTTSTELAIEWINALRSLGGLRKKIKAGETIDLSTLNISKEETADETAAVETETATRERVNSQLTMDEMEQLAEGKEEREATKEETGIGGGIGGLSILPLPLPLLLSFRRSFSPNDNQTPSDNDVHCGHNEQDQRRDRGSYNAANTFHIVDVFLQPDRSKSHTRTQ
jgi:hypothetical protein